MKKMYFALLMLGLVMTSCGDSAQSGSTRADDLCKCITDAGVDFDGINNLSDLDKLESKFDKISSKKQKKGEECILDVIKDIKKDLKGMKDKEKSKYIREFMKGLIDSKCMVDGMSGFEYDELEEILDEMIEEMKEEIDNDEDDDYRSRGSSSVDATESYTPESDYNDYYEESNDTRGEDVPATTMGGDMVMPDMPEADWD